MKTFNIEEYNRMCAEFLGFKYKNQTKFWTSYPLSDDSYLSQLGYIRMDDLIFHSDWNWIHEIVEKIEDLDVIASFQIENPTIYIWASTENSTFEDIQVDIFDKTKKEAVVQAIWEFLNYYNSIKEDE